MSKPCNRCELIISVQRMMKSDMIKIPIYDVRKAIKRFIDGEITFKEVGTALGLSGNEMLKYTNTDNLNRYINGTDTE